MTTRSVYFLGFTIVIVLLLTSAYFQMVDGFMPCPLCTLQRITFGMLGLLFIIGLFTYTRRIARMTMNTLCLVTAAIGMMLAGRQIWLQQFSSPDNAECGVSIQYMMQVLPWHQVLQKILAGSAECSEPGWKLLYLNMAEWAFIWFAILFCMMVYLLIKEWAGNARQ